MPPRDRRTRPHTTGSSRCSSHHEANPFARPAGAIVFGGLASIAFGELIRVVIDIEANTSREKQDQVTAVAEASQPRSPVLDSPG